MCHCAVIGCNNYSRNVNKRNSGVSYHKFPKIPYVKDKWIRATGKCNWCPQNHDTICSEHFEAESFMKKGSKTYLQFDAIPTLQLRPIFDEINSLTNSNNIHNTADLASPRRRKIMDPPDPTPPKRTKKQDPPDLAPTIHIKELNSPDLALAIRIKEEDFTDVAPANHIKELNYPDLAPAIRIKEEDFSDVAPANHIKEKDSPDLAPVIRIKEEDYPDLAPENRVKEEEPPDLAPAIRIKEEDPLALIEITVEKLHVKPADESQAKREAYYIPNPQDSHQTRHLKLSLTEAQDTIKRQRLQVRRIIETNRRLTQKVAKMENIIKCLREQSAKY